MKPRDEQRAGLLRVAGFALCGVLANLARAEAPPGRYTVAADTVRDNRTGLTWQRAVQASEYDWASAKTYCDGLVLASASDWRVPNKLELESLVDYTRADPAIDSLAFPSTPSTPFWSSSPYVAVADDAWEVQFLNGAAYHLARSTELRVRCVR